MALLLFLVAFLLPLSILAVSNNNGFSLELIHRDSIHSPIYNPNLTVGERLSRIVDITKSRTHWLEASNLQTSDVSIRPIMDHEQWMYMVRVSIGDMRSELRLLFDTGSHNIWTQCFPCDPCFPQLPPKFNPAASRTYQPLRQNHPLCRNYSYGACRYDLRYMSGGYTRGVLAMEKFTFASISSGFRVINDIVFGCSHSSSVDMFPTQKLGGIMGMSRGETSFPMQLAPITQSRFSYCLVSVNDRSGISYLRFGSDIALRGNPQTTRFVYTSETKGYYLDLLDISINSRRLNLTSGIFARHPDRTGGCIIDSGAGFSPMIELAYNVIKMELIDYFHRYNLQRIDGKYGFDLCYHKPSSFNAFPTLTYHFRGANLQSAGENLFTILVREQAFCLTIIPSNRMTIIGMHQQQNIRFIYDLARQQLTFAPENCARN